MTITDQINDYDPTFGLSTVTVGQIKRALIAQSLMQQVSDAINADVTSTVNVEWTNGIWFSQGDDLYNFIKSTLGYTDLQMAALIVAAGALPR